MTITYKKTMTNGITESTDKDIPSDFQNIFLYDKIKLPKNITLSNPEDRDCLEQVDSLYGYEMKILHLDLSIFEFLMEVKDFDLDKHLSKWEDILYDKGWEIMWKSDLFHKGDYGLNMFWLVRFP